MIFKPSELTTAQIPQKKNTTRWTINKQCPWQYQFQLAQFMESWAKLMAIYLQPWHIRHFVNLPNWVHMNGLYSSGFQHWQICDVCKSYFSSQCDLVCKHKRNNRSAPVFIIRITERGQGMHWHKQVGLNHSNKDQSSEHANEWVVSGKQVVCFDWQLVYLNQDCSEGRRKTRSP